MSVAFIIVDSSSNQTVAQPGQPPSTAAAWRIDIPAGQVAKKVVEDFVTSQNFPLGSRVYMVDAANVTQFKISAGLFALAPPTAPTNITAQAGDMQATVSWTAPSTDGGSPIDSFTIIPFESGSAQAPFTIEGDVTQAVVPDLANGMSYTFEVVANNGVGSSPASTASAAVTPSAPARVPAAPTSVSATAAPGQATVTWTESNDGGSPITDYNVTPYANGVAQAPTVVGGSPPPTTTTITGLTNGMLYTFTVTAVNAIGASPSSAPSTSVTP